MRLYFNGCSHTYGDDLDDKNLAWPSVLSRQLGCEFFNDSVSGGTNDRIRYRTLKFADQFDKFYIAWTYTSRFTRYRADNNHDVNFNVQLKNSLYDKTPEYQHYGKLHYATWHNELYAFKLWLQDIILMQRFFESIKKPYVMINSVDNLIDRWSVSCDLFNDSVKSLLCFDLMDDEQLYNEHQEIQSLIKQIDLSKYVGWNSWWLIKLSKDYPVGNTGHLLSEGHGAAAQHIINYDPY
ncbi:hypothetical protein UFOVP328_236 [uncultured Caudovirales phage]|uniref:Uncharacterized protein n=1 Tax=uncultured Caudovirales phage TaxID=2100421 RepID=A0A6J5LY37_9CAUD|nr:hypothetical protein UFOVP328_236 [uncultured Caudovirales phage]